MQRCLVQNVGEQYAADSVKRRRHQLSLLIHSAKGGLAAGGSHEEDAFVDVSDKTKAAGMRFSMEDIRFEQ